MHAAHPRLGSFLAAIFIGCCTPGAGAQTGTPATLHSCTGEGCAGLSRAELFINTFGSTGASRGLSTSRLEQQEQVRLAFYAIDATRVEVEKGRLSVKDGELIIAGHEQRIRNYVHDQANDAYVIASGGQIGDIPAINKPLGALLSVARQDALLGREEVAQQAQAQMVRVLTTFSQAFANNCESQSAPLQTVIELERQNELMGTGISLTHCLTRKFTVDITSQGIDYHFKTCSNLHASTVWDVKVSGPRGGEGKAGDVMWEIPDPGQTGWNPWGAVELTTEELALESESASVPRPPHDAGPDARPNGWIAAPVPTREWRPPRIEFKRMRIEPITVRGGKQFIGDPVSGTWVAGEVESDGYPCKPVTTD